MTHDAMAVAAFEFTNGPFVGLACLRHREECSSLVKQRNSIAEASTERLLAVDAAAETGTDDSKYLNPTSSVSDEPPCNDMDRGCGISM